MYRECCSVQYDTTRWQHASNAPTNTVAPMPMTSVAPVRTSVAGAAALHPQLINAANANPLMSSLAGSPFLNQYPSGLAGLSPLLSTASFPGANPGTLGGMQPPAGSSSASDPNVELASKLSQLMLGSVGHSVVLAQQNILANMFTANPHGLQSLLAAGGGNSFGLANQYAGMMQPGLQNFPSAGGSAGLLSQAQQQQLLLNASLLSSVSQNPTMPSNLHSATLASVNHSGVAAPPGGQFSSAAGIAQLGSTVVPPPYEPQLPADASHHLGQYPPPRG